MATPSPDTSPNNASSQAANSFDAATYVHQTAHLLNLSIPLEQMASVVENFERIQAIAQPVLDFPLPDTLESAPRFEP
ncbi:MAG: DUF4089 domain-containing protein [Leptolyngbya sp. SIO3F4]|nr:DUF4089 domain-containing protein [Leptolyngbya sp. SIO3F4]